MSTKSRKLKNQKAKIHNQKFNGRNGKMRKVHLNNSEDQKVEALETFVINLSPQLGLQPSDFIPIFIETSASVSHKNGIYNENGIKHTLHYICDDYRLIFKEFNENIVELYWIQVFEKGTGLGTDIMKKILKISDELEIGVRLIPVDIDNNERKIENLIRLRNWYKSFGFKSNDYNRTPVLFYEPQIEELKQVA